MYKYLYRKNYQLSGLHEKLVEFGRVALVEEGLGRVLMQNRDRVVDLKKSFLKFVYKNPSISIVQLKLLNEWSVFGVDTKIVHHNKFIG